MRKLIIIFIFLSSMQLQAENKTVQAATPASAVPISTIKELEVFAQKKLNEKKDLEEVKKVIKILIALDNEDPSRTAVMDLSESYNKNKKIYNKAFKALETKKNKIQLNEIKNLMAQAENGNG